jgi:hypothetical protein
MMVDVRTDLLSAKTRFLINSAVAELFRVNVAFISFIVKLNFGELLLKARSITNLADDAIVPSVIEVLQQQLPK